VKVAFFSDNSDNLCIGNGKRDLTPALILIGCLQCQGQNGLGK
jgi:hypothetical protein